MSSNKTIYSTKEFNNWSERGKLLPEEQILIEKYLDKNRISVEAGTAGGRILLEMHQLGFKSLFGYDFVSEFIHIAKKRDYSNNIVFSVQDATKLNYSDASFDQAIYMQQIISTIEDPSKRLKSLQEAFRILKTGGIILFSFLSFESKKKSIFSNLFISYLTLVRTFFHRNLNIQCLPWLKYTGKTNWNSLLDREPYNYWYKTDEVFKLLEEVGFSITALGYTKQILGNYMHTSYETLKATHGDGHIYFVCKK